MAAPALLLEATVAFLRTHEPFARMARADLEFIAGRARLAYFAAGSVIAEPADGGAPPLYVVQRGQVRAEDAARAAGPVLLGAGECFPLAPAVGTPSPPLSYLAVDDVFCYRLGATDVAHLHAASPVFADYCARTTATLLRRSLAGAHREFSARALDQQTLLQPVEALLRRAPVTCHGDTPLRVALAQMNAAAVGTIAVVDAAGRPVGIFTLTDLLNRVVLPGMSLAAPVASVMSAAPGTADVATSAEEAMAMMATTGYHQLLITRGGITVGVVSERDLFALQRVSMQHIVEAIRAAADVAALGPVAADIATFTDNLVAQGAAAEALTRTVAALHDALAQRLFAVLAPQFSLDGLDWCWLSLGSEGRREQTIVSDQDNALVFSAPPEAVGECRTRLLAFARACNAALAALGVPLCPGNIMAGNAELCLSDAEWRGRFAGWLREPDPAALLAANIFFDFRPLAGDLRLAEELRSWLAGLAPGSSVFLRLLAANALQAEPPLGVVRAFRTADEGEFAGTLDLKKEGTRIFVDAARALALAFGIVDTGTATRLRLAGRRLGLDERDIASIVEAFHFLQLLRLRTQRGAGAPAAAVNRIDPQQLNELDQRMLKEAFRQARELQKLLALTLAP
jgi:CBS domain-containing protein